MSTFITRNETTYATQVVVTEDTLIVDLDDGRTISVPLSWFPLLGKGEKDSTPFLKVRR